MTVNGRRSLIIAIIVGALLVLSAGRMPFASGIGSLPTGILVQLLMLWPLALVAAIVWFGFEVLGTLRRIEQQVTERASVEDPYGS